VKIAAHPTRKIIVAAFNPNSLGFLIRSPEFRQSRRGIGVNFMKWCVLPQEPLQLSFFNRIDAELPAMLRYILVARAGDADLSIVL
jgi:hypothetical protein